MVLYEIQGVVPVKKIIKSVCLAAAAVCLGADAFGAASGGNLLKNADFEQGFEHWRKSGSIWRVEDGAGYGGTKGLVWECNDAGK